MFNLWERKSKCLFIFVVLSFVTIKISAQGQDQFNASKNLLISEKKINLRQNEESKDREVILNKIGFYKKSISENPNNPLLYNNLGSAYARSGNYEEAIIVLKKAIELNPNLSISHFNLSVIYDYQERFAEALESVQKAVLLDGSNAEFRTEKCQILASLERYVESVPCYEILFQLKEPNVQERVNYNLSLLFAGQSEKAYLELQKTAQIFSDEAIAQNALGMYYFMTKNQKQAIPYFYKAVELNPELDAARFNLAIVQLALNDRESAIKNYALLKNSNADYAAQLYKYLFSRNIIKVNN